VVLSVHIFVKILVPALKASAEAAVGAVSAMAIAGDQLARIPELIEEYERIEPEDESH